MSTLLNRSQTPNHARLSNRASVTYRRLQEEAAPGSHIVTARRGYLHHGIYAGAGKVIHYAGLSSGLHRGPVEETSLRSFARGRTVRVKPGAPARFDHRQVVDRARSRIGEDSYRLLTNNCEHFCEWCLHGENRSYQVEALVARPGHLLRAVLRLSAEWTWRALQTVLCRSASAEEVGQRARGTA